MKDAKMLSFLVAVDAIDKELVDLRMLVKVLSMEASCPGLICFSPLSDLRFLVSLSLRVNGLR